MLTKYFFYFILFFSDKGAKSEDIVLFEKSRAKKTAGEGKFRCKNLNPFAIFLHRRDVAKTCFYSTLNLKRLESFRGRNRKTYSMKRKKEDTVRGLGIGQKVDSGNKVLPIRDVASSSSSSSSNGVKEEY